MEEINEMLENTRLLYADMKGCSFDYSFIGGNVQVSMCEDVYPFASMVKICTCDRCEVERVIEELKKWNCNRNNNKQK